MIYRHLLRLLFGVEKPPVKDAVLASIAEDHISPCFIDGSSSDPMMRVARPYALDETALLRKPRVART